MRLVLRFLLAAFLVIIAQHGSWAVESDLYCLNTGTVPPAFVPCSSGNPLQISGAITIGGTVSVTQGTTPWITKDQADGSISGGTAGSFSLLIGGQYNSSAPVLSNGQQASAQLDSSGNIKVTGGVSQGSTTSGQTGSLVQGAVTAAVPSFSDGQTDPLSLNTSGSLRTALQDCAPGHLLSAASNNSTNVKNAAGEICALVIVNTTATMYDFRLYNSSTGPLCASPSSVAWNTPVPASTSGAGFTVSLPNNMSFTTGIGFCLTGANADNDNTNAATGVNINYTFR